MLLIIKVEIFKFILSHQYPLECPLSPDELLIFLLIKPKIFTNLKRICPLPIFNCNHFNFHAFIAFDEVSLPEVDKVLTMS